MQTLDDYFRAQQVAPQWATFLNNLGRALLASAQGSEDVLRELFCGVGRKSATDLDGQFDRVSTLADVQDVFNQYWRMTQWGLVELQENEDHIAIEHRFAPLAESFGLKALPWSVGYLEGFYEAAFIEAGTGDDLRVECVGSEDDGMRLIFKLFLNA